jgi:hypothetical protein
MWSEDFGKLYVYRIDTRDTVMQTRVDFKLIIYQS